MKSFNLFKEQVDAKAFLVLAEKQMTAAQMKKREEIAQSMNDEEFKKRYGKDWMAVKMATATKQAMKEETVEEEYVEHWCAKHIYHDVFGEGVVVEGEHGLPNEQGVIEWYTVEFAHGKETVFTEDIEVLHERYHGHMMKKNRMGEMEDGYEMDDEEEDDEEEEMMKKRKMGEELVGNQHKIDMNKNQKIDAQDFKLLRKIKQARAK